MEGAPAFESARLILIDGPPTEAAQAAFALGCAAAEAGAVPLFYAAPEAGDALTPLVRRLGEVGGVRLLPRAATSSESLEAEREAGDARAEAYEAALGAPTESLRVIALGQPDGARDPVGITGYVWRPLGARLPTQGLLSLRAEASLRPGIRVKLRPFEDVPMRGAVMRYDGLIEIGPPPEPLPPDAAANR